MKREVIVWTDRELSLMERKDYKRENPGKRLCFRLRFPDFPLYASLTSIIIILIVLLVQLLI